MPNRQVRVDVAAIEAWRKRHPDQEQRSLKHIIETLLWNDYPKTTSIESAQIEKPLEIVSSNSLSGEQLEFVQMEETKEDEPMNIDDFDIDDIEEE